MIISILIALILFFIVLPIAAALVADFWKEILWGIGVLIAISLVLIFDLGDIALTLFGYGLLIVVLVTFTLGGIRFIDAVRRILIGEVPLIESTEDRQARLAREVDRYSAERILDLLLKEQGDRLFLTGDFDALREDWLIYITTELPYKRGTYDRSMGTAQELIGCRVNSDIGVLRAGRLIKKALREIAEKTPVDSNRIKSTLSDMFTWGVEMGHLSVNPIEVESGKQEQ